MKLLGLKDSLRSEAERQFGWEFRAWIAEVERIEWQGWPEMLRFYPLAKRLDENRALFPLADDGSGIAAHVFFEEPSFIALQEVILLAPRPRMPARSKTSHPSH